MNKIKYERVASVNGVLGCHAVWNGVELVKYAVLRNGNVRLLWVLEDSDAANTAVAALSKRIPEVV